MTEVFFNIDDADCLGEVILQPAMDGKTDNVERGVFYLISRENYDFHFAPKTPQDPVIQKVKATVEIKGEASTMTAALQLATPAAQGAEGLLFAAEAQGLVFAPGAQGPVFTAGAEGAVFTAEVPGGPVFAPGTEGPIFPIGAQGPVFAPEEDEPGTYIVAEVQSFESIKSE